ncbi:MAG TPA: hypothetical protein VNK04_21610 [Gemmataceae bacterium]|nr:hypothetical protein [Gemmataceae bacterium]
MRYANPVLIILALLLVLPGGCRKKPTQPEPPPPQAQSGGGNPILPPAGQVVQGQGAVQNVRRAVRRTVDLNDLKNLSVAYYQHLLQNGQGPKSLNDVKGSISPNLEEAIKEGHCVVIWGLRNVGSNTVIAYVKEPDIYGTRVVAKGDGSAVRMNEAEFQAALKGQ